MKNYSSPTSKQDLIRYTINNSSLEEKTALLTWAKELENIRKSDGSNLAKAKQSISLTLKSNIIWPILKRMNSQLTKILWTDRSWKMRLGLGAGAVTALTIGGQGAGIAALGTAVGVPLYLVLGAGGILLGTLIDELEELIQKDVNRSRSPVIDIEIVEKKNKNSTKKKQLSNPRKQLTTKKSKPKPPSPKS